mgnify:FL=1
MHNLRLYITKTVLLIFFALGGTFVFEADATPLTDKQVNKRLKKCMGIKPVNNAYFQPIVYTDCFDTSIEGTYNHCTTIVPIEDEIKYNPYI